MSDAPRLPRKLHRLAAEQNNRCAYCQEPFGDFSHEANPTLDHVVPESRGGKRNDANLVAACARCNHAKGDMDASDFCAMIDAGKLRRRRSMDAIKAHRKDALEQGKELYFALEAAQKANRSLSPAGPPRPPHSKNPPLKRLYTQEEARHWDEDRYARK